MDQPGAKSPDRVSRDAYCSSRPQPTITPPSRLNCDSGAVNYNDVWALALDGAAEWTELPVGGTLPPARSHHVAIYDPLRDRMLVSGGLVGGFCWCYCGTIFGDVWSLDLASTTWQQIPPSYWWGARRYAHSAVYDATRDQMLLFGGTELNYGHGTYNDAHAYSLAESVWTALSLDSLPPPARVNHSAVYDGQIDRMLVFGGQVPAFENDLWALLLGSQVVSVPPTGPTSGSIVLSIRPNPASSAVWVDMSLPTDQPAVLDVVDVAGRRVLSQPLAARVGSQSVALPEAVRLEPGQYFVRVTQGVEQVIARLTLRP